MKNRPYLTEIETLIAINARIHVRWDDPALIKWGPLGDTVDDIAEIVDARLSQLGVTPTY